MDDADPCNCWPEAAVAKERFGRNDVYGGLYNYLFDMISGLCERLQRQTVSFRLWMVDIKDLSKIPEYIQMKNGFDRIEVGVTC